MSVSMLFVLFLVDIIVVEYLISSAWLWIMSWSSWCIYSWNSPSCILEEIRQQSFYCFLQQWSVVRENPAFNIEHNSRSLISPFILWTGDCAVMNLASWNSVHIIYLLHANCIIVKTTLSIVTDSTSSFMPVTYTQCESAVICEDNGVPMVDLHSLVFFWEYQSRFMVLGCEHMYHRYQRTLRPQSTFVKYFSDSLVKNVQPVGGHFVLLLKCSSCPPHTMEWIVLLELVWCLSIAPSSSPCVWATLLTVLGDTPCN